MQIENISYPIVSITHAHFVSVFASALSPVLSTPAVSILDSTQIVFLLVLKVPKYA